METTQNFDVLSMLKNKLMQDYEPGTGPKATAMSTKEVYEAMQAVYPSEHYGPDTIAEWLGEGGFKLVDYGDMRMLWQIARK